MQEKVQENINIDRECLGKGIYSNPIHKKGNHNIHPSLTLNSIESVTHTLHTKLPPAAACSGASPPPTTFVLAIFAAEHLAIVLELLEIASVK